MDTSVFSGFLLGRMGDNGIGSTLVLIDCDDDCDGSFFGVLCEKTGAEEGKSLFIAVAECETDNGRVSVFSLFLLQAFVEEFP